MNLIYPPKYPCSLTRRAVYYAYPNAGLEEAPALIGLCWTDDLMHLEIENPCLCVEDSAGAPGTME